MQYIKKYVKFIYQCCLSKRVWLSWIAFLLSLAVFLIEWNTQNAWPLFWLSIALLILTLVLLIIQLLYFTEKHKIQSWVAIVLIILFVSVGSFSAIDHALVNQQNYVNMVALLLTALQFSWQKEEEEERPQ